MPYYKEINTLFIHIPKTGGTSLEWYLRRRYSESLFSKTSNNDILPEIQLQNKALQHLPYQIIEKYQQELDIDISDESMKIISIVRNPYEKVLSDLFWFKKIKETDTPDRISNSVRQYLYNFDWDNHTLPQYQFLINSEGELLNNIKLFHTEDLTDELRDYGFTDFNNYFYKSNKAELYHKLLNDDSKKMIYSFYQKDFELFNYNQEY